MNTSEYKTKQITWKINIIIVHLTACFKDFIIDFHTKKRIFVDDTSTGEPASMMLVNSAVFFAKRHAV